MNYTEEYVRQLENVIDSLRVENAVLREKLAAAEKQTEALKAEVERLSERGAEPVRTSRGDSLLTFFELTNSELLALAPAPEKPGNSFLIVNNVLIKYTGKGGDVVVPDGLKNIDKKAFAQCDTLTSVIIPYSVTKIGDSAFVFCRSLKSAALADGVKQIGNAAFAWCEALTSVTVPPSVTHIGKDAFKYCHKLKIYCRAGSYAEQFCRKNYLNHATY